MKWPLEKALSTKCHVAPQRVGTPIPHASVLIAGPPCTACHTQTSSSVATIFLSDRLPPVRKNVITSVINLHRAGQKAL